MPLLPPVINAVLFASLLAMAISLHGCIIKLCCPHRADGLILQLHNAVTACLPAGGGSGDQPW
jgi:hypothetical protein